MFSNIKTIFKKKLINNNDNIIVFFSFLILVNLFLSINSGVYHFQLFAIKDNLLETLFSLINVYRFSITFILFPIILYIFLKYKTKTSFFTKFFIFYLILQFFTIFIFERDQKYIDIHSPQILDSVALLLGSALTLLIFQH